ncbi:putative laccase [Helianthus anomalus]
MAAMEVSSSGILINGQFPGPTIECETNDHVIVNVVNKLDEPFLITWNGVKQRKTSWQDGVLGTNCPIPPGGQWTYHMQVKDQIGTFSYFASLGMHRAVGAFGGFNIRARPVIFAPYLKPTLRQRLDSRKAHLKPAGLLINGSPRATSFTGQAGIELLISFRCISGQRYLFRVSNVALTTSINFRIQGHTLQLVEVEGAHTLHEFYESIDLHVGQTASFLVTLHSPAKGYYIVAKGYVGSTAKPSLPLPIAPPKMSISTVVKPTLSQRNNYSRKSVGQSIATIPVC